MPRLTHRLAFRWVLPLVQLLACFLILLPVRGRLLFGIVMSAHAYAPEKETGDTLIQAGSIRVILPPTAEEPRMAKQADIRLRAPLVLDFPVIVAEVPYILLSPIRREWVPRGMPPETWRALSFPFLGLVFWWWLGRGVDALLALNRSEVQPRLTRIDTVFAVFLLCVGVISACGAVTSTPDDRKDIQFVTLLAGGIVWGVLAVVPIIARFRQRRILNVAS